MSFNFEPPPLDSECPPPLDDFEEKMDFDKNLDDLEENTTDFDMELPTDYNFFATAALDTNFGIQAPEIPKDFNNFIIRYDSPPPLDIIEKEINLEDTTRKNCESPVHNNNDSDVAIEKEDISVGVIEVPVNVEHKVDASVIKKLNDEDDEVLLSSSNDNSFDDFHFVPPPLDDDKNSEENSVKIDQFVQSDDIQVQDVEIKLEDFIESDDESKKDDLRNIPERVETLEDNESFEIPDDVPLDQSPNLSLNLDDDDDDFKDFESAIPVNRPLETHNFITPVATLDSPDEFQFEADFSNFNAFESSENATTNLFNENVQGFSPIIETEKVAEEKIEQKEQLDDFDDDDDFGDFSDFTQAPAPIVQPPLAQFDNESLLKTLKSTNLKEVIDMMFPQSQTERQQSLDEEQHENVLTNNEFVKSLSDFDTTLALGYQYNNSSTSQSLVMALGIDARNILLHQWNSGSSSSMPRYAANLTFSPLEPMKPTISNSPMLPVKIITVAPPPPTPSIEVKPPILQPTKTPASHPPEIVPEVEFDWNTSGLVNPLDANAHILLDLDQLVASNYDKIKLDSSTLCNASTTDVSSFNNFNFAQTTKTTNKKSHPPLNNDMFADVLRQFDALNPTNNTTSNTITNKFIATFQTMKFTNKMDFSEQPKTKHNDDGPTVFPPAPSSKLQSVSNESESTVHSVDQTAPQVLQIQTKANQSELVTEVVITDDSKPTLDHTYQWQNDIPPETSGDERFLTAPIVTQSKVGLYNSNGTSSNSINVRERTIKLPETHIFTPVKGSNPISQEVISDDPITVTLAAGSETLYAKSQIIVKEYHDIEYSLEMPKADMEVDNSDFTNSSVEEDDFNDFQAAMPSISAVPNIVENPIHTKYSHLNDSITLSPRRLVPNVNKPEENHQQSAWISSMDADEIDRIQAAFPKCKTDLSKKTIPKANDDEEWSDFVVVSPSSIHQQPMSLPSFASSMPPSTISSNYLQNSSHPVSNGGGVESDDWSDFVSVPAKMTATGAKHISISNQFPSRPNFAWNQSKAPASFTHHTSFLSEAPRNQNYNNSVNITNNFNYNYAMNQQQPNFQSQQKPNISTILPELDFALPKTLLNLPRSHSHSNGSANQLPKK
ncbi:unnamed protein product [Diamesa serratosioi]